MYLVLSKSPPRTFQCIRLLDPLCDRIQYFTIACTNLRVVVMERRSRKSAYIRRYITNFTQNETLVAIFFIAMEKARIRGSLKSKCNIG